MSLSAETKKFIAAHITDHPDQLLLNAKRYPNIDIPFAVKQITARQHIKSKLPSWFSNPDLIFPSRLSVEQCSSEITGHYKQQLIADCRVCDLTGGLGVDSYFFSQKAKEVVYVERFPEYCAAAAENFKALNATNIRVLNEDACQVAAQITTDLFYIDPARRGEGNKRVFALSECEPDILQLKPFLLENARRTIIKISPMADIDETLRLLPETSEIHIVAVRNECKELLFVLEEQEHYHPENVQVRAVNFDSFGNIQSFSFRSGEERSAELQTTDRIKKYLYEPHAALLKSGAFKLTGLRLGLEKLHRHSHLYTSDELCPDFPGRSFIVDEVFEFSGKWLKQLKNNLPQANLTTRNFALSVAEIRKKSGIKEGGDIYLFATTLSNEHRVVIQCHKSI